MPSSNGYFSFLPNPKPQMIIFSITQHILTNRCPPAGAAINTELPISFLILHNKRQNRRRRGRRLVDSGQQGLSVTDKEVICYAELFLGVSTAIGLVVYTLHFHFIQLLIILLKFSQVHIKPHHRLKNVWTLCTLCTCSPSIKCLKAVSHPSK